MSAATYFLTTHPDVLARAAAEVRESYANDDRISLNHDVQTPYVEAVLNETLRLFPAAPVPVPRVINKDGEIIDGRYIPPGVSNLAYSFCPYTCFPVSLYHLSVPDLKT